MSFRWLRNRWIWMPLAGIAVLSIVVSLFNREATDVKTIAFSEVIALARDGRVDEIEQRGPRLEVTLRDGTEYRSRIDRGVDLHDAMRSEGVTIGGQDNDAVAITYKPPFAAWNWFGILVNFAPFIVFLAFLIYLARTVRELSRATQSLADAAHALSRDAGIPPGPPAE